jgi:hypothetical protein
MPVAKFMPARQQVTRSRPDKKTHYVDHDKRQAQLSTRVMPPQSICTEYSIEPVTTGLAASMSSREAQQQGQHQHHKHVSKHALRSRQMNAASDDKASGKQGKGSGTLTHLLRHWSCWGWNKRIDRAISPSELPGTAAMGACCKQSTVAKPAKLQVNLPRLCGRALEYTDTNETMRNRSPVAGKVRKSLVQDSESARKRQLSLADLAALIELNVEQGTALPRLERTPCAGLET